MKVSKLARMMVAYVLIVGLVGSLTAEPVPVMIEALAPTVQGMRTALADGSVIYVDADATGVQDGTSWENAYTTLQPALEDAAGGDEVWVAEGTYTPTYLFSPGDPRSATFQLKNGVALYGGFDPTVGDIGWEDRDWEAHETILSGDLDGNDGPDFANYEDNSYHVFYHPDGTGLDATAILDGFTITGGNADGDNIHNGGGMFNVFSSPSLSNCTFAGNSARFDGGGIFNSNSSPKLTNCTFSDNSATFGGGMSNNGSSPTLTNCTFSGNSAEHGGGGGMYNVDKSSPVVTNCIFQDNVAAYGGGMTNYYSSSPVVTGCTFLSNSADSGGGGMDNQDSSPVVTNCTFSGNSARSGGGMDNASSSPIVTNCIFSGNSAILIGGGMSNGSSSPVMTNCTFSHNSAGSGGGMYNSSSSPLATNCILWGDTAGGLPNEIAGSSLEVTYSDIQGGYGGTGNIDADPLFVGPHSGDYHLSPGSPCIDAGTNESPNLPDVDFEGNPRVMDGNGDGVAVADMGADEVLTNVIYVDQSASGDNDGTSWGDAYTTLQPALEEATGGYHIWVAEGIYTPTQELSPGDPRSATFQLKNGVALYGGFDPSVGDVDWEDRDWANNLTTLSGDIGIAGDPDDNSYHVFYHGGVALDGSAVLDGFTVTDGNASGDPPDHDKGGGMYNYDSSPTVTNCTFSGNSAHYGGGIYNNSSSPVLNSCSFSGNSATEGGGGVHNSSSSPELTNCTFSGNSALIGGGMRNSDSSPDMVQCTFEGNSADDSGGGMWNAGSSPTLTDCVFQGNSAPGGGGMINFSSTPVLTSCRFSFNAGSGMTNSSSSPVLVGCTFAGNTNDHWGGGMSNLFSSSPVLTNCIFAGNWAGISGGGMYNQDESSPKLTNCTLSGNVGGAIFNRRRSSPSLANCILWNDGYDEIVNEDLDCAPVVTYSDIQGGYEGEGNIDADPLFVDPGSEDYHLGAGSPCIDAGTTDAPNLPAHDFEGDPRVLDGDADGTAVVDMGADEVWGPPPDIIHVDQDAVGYCNGTSWEDALIDLQQALAWAEDGVEIWVAQGTYTPTYLYFPGDPRSATFQLRNGVALYGGFDPTVGDTGWEDRDWLNNVTVLSGDIGTVGDRRDNSYHVFYHSSPLALDGTAILDGFTVSDGNANGDLADNHGGGMYNGSSSPTVTNCTFSSNSAVSDGGGMCNYDSSPALTNCSFSGNSAIFGAGMHNTSSSPALTSCTFSDNSAQNGGAMFNMISLPALTNCTFSGNVTSNSGGAMYNTYSSPILTNCTFSGNSATSFSGGGIYNSYSSSPTLTNCILWGDTAGGLPEEICNHDVDSIPVVTYSDVQGGYDGTGNIDEDPRFVDENGGDYHLQPDSPCIDTGYNDSPNLPAHDFEGDDRVLDGDGNVTAIVDMGVDEVSVDWPYFYLYLPMVLSGD